MPLLLLLLLLWLVVVLLMLLRLLFLLLLLVSSAASLGSRKDDMSHSTEAGTRTSHPVVSGSNMLPLLPLMCCHWCHWSQVQWVQGHEGMIEGVRHRRRLPIGLLTQLSRVRIWLVEKSCGPMWLTIKRYTVKFMLWNVASGDRKRVWESVRKWVRERESMCKRVPRFKPY